MEPRDPEEALPDEIEAEVTGAEDIEALKQALAGEKARAESNLAGWQRVQADFINYKRRVEQEKGEIIKQASAGLILDLLPVLDDLERAFASIPDELTEVGWVDGIRLIERKMRATLEAQGLSPMKVVGEPFDPNLHEAAMQAEGREGIVVEELVKGYQYRDRVIRPARVVVGNGEEEKKEG